jgi:hypothetical protein
MSAEPDHVKKGHKVNLKYVALLITTEIVPVADKVVAMPLAPRRKRSVAWTDGWPSKRTKLTQTSGARHLNSHSQEKEEAKFVDVRLTPTRLLSYTDAVATGSQMLLMMTIRLSPSQTIPWTPYSSSAETQCLSRARREKIQS